MQAVIGADFRVWRFRVGLLICAALLVAAAPAPLKPLIQKTEIPFSQFTLPNGLRVLVHTDRKAPVVAVSVYYHIGSKDEPLGKTGFAHLFEHLMFYGSEHHDKLFFEPLENVGATGANGDTSFDRTHYYETVPTPALDLVLFLESDRMGHLLGAVTQKKLDAQRAVVQNEKRQRDNEPYGLADYAISEGLFAPGHPYAHGIIGSLKDLSTASLADVHGWFKNNYGPGNAVLALAGDIDLPTAQALVSRYFGDIPAGPTPARYFAPVPKSHALVRESMTDVVASPRITRSYVVPGRLDPATPLIDIAATILAGGSSSRMYNALVRNERLAVGVSGGVQALENVSQLTFEIDVRPGVDPNRVSRRFDALMAGFLKSGATADEVQRVSTRAVSGTVRGLEDVGSKASTLSEGLLYANDANFYRTELSRYADATPAAVTAAARNWMARGGHELIIVPGERVARDVKETRVAPKLAQAAIAAKPVQLSVGIDRAVLPDVGATLDLAFPPVTRATLSNGMIVTLAQRHSIPVVQMILSFDAGIAADDRAKPGTQSLMLALLDEGTTTRSGTQIAEQQERLGAQISATSGIDRTRISLSALVPNLTNSLDLYADIVRNPRFAPAEIDRVRGQALAGIAAENNDPQSLALRELPPLLYGVAHPYGLPLTGSGTIAGVKSVTQADLQRFHQRWLRPDNAELFVVGDIRMAELLPQLERSFGGWAAPVTPRGQKAFPPVSTEHGARIIMIDRPGSPQSQILGGTILAKTGRDDQIALQAANDILGGQSTSRLNIDIREEKGWAYGVQSLAVTVVHEMPLLIFAPVQTDRTGDALAAIIADMAALGSTRPIAADEMARTINNNVRALPGQFETASAVLGSIERNAIFARPDNYQAGLAARYRAAMLSDLQSAATLLSPKNAVWMIIGDRKLVEPQLAKLGLPVEFRAAQ